MRKIVFAALFVCAYAYADSSYKVTVTTNSTTVLPYADASGLSITAWASGTTYDQGDYARIGGARYWTPNGGTSTNQPTLVEGSYTYADGVTWVRITNADRRNSAISNLGATTVWLSLGGVDAVVSNGIPLYSYERYMYEGQKELSVVVESGTAVVSVADEDEG